MKPLARLTETALMHFVNTGEWGDFAAESIDAEKAVHHSQDDGAVFIMRSSISGNAAPSEKGRSNYWRLLYVYGAPPTKRYNVCLKMYFGSDGSAIYPGLQTSSKEAYLVSLENMQWLKSLMEIASYEIKPFEMLLNAVKHRSRRPSSDDWSPRFDIYVDFMKKQISELAEDFGRRKSEDRFHHESVAKTWDRELSAGLDALAKSSGATGVKRSRKVASSEFYLSLMTKRCSTRLPLSSRIASSWEENELKDWLAERAWKSADAGGPVDLAFAESTAPPQSAYGRGYKSVDELQASGLWWWRGIEDLPEAAKGVFQNNWFRSAYYYEFRARENLKELSYWPFEVPWAWLGQLERAALYYLWPPAKKAGVYEFDSSILSPPTDRRFDNKTEMTIDADMNAAQIRDAAAKAKRELERTAECLPSLGAPTPADAFPLRGDPEDAWKFLEALDCARHGIYSLNDQAKQLERMRDRYSTDCDDVRLWDGLRL